MAKQIEREVGNLMVYDEVCTMAYTVCSLVSAQHSWNWHCSLQARLHRMTADLGWCRHLGNIKHVFEPAILALLKCSVLRWCKQPWMVTSSA